MPPSYVVRLIKFGVTGALLALFIHLFGLDPATDPDIPQVSTGNGPYKGLAGRAAEGHPPLDRRGLKGRLTLLQYSPAGFPVQSERERALLNQFARSENLLPEWHSITQLPDPAKGAGLGNPTIITSLNPELLEKLGDDVLPTLPWAISKQQIIGRAGSHSTRTLSDLTVRQLAIKQSSPAREQIFDLAAKHRTMEIVVIPEDLKVEEILDRVHSGQYDLAVLDSLSLPEDLEFHYGLEAVLDLTNESFMSWGVSPDSMALHTALNKFLSKKHLESGIGRRYRDDFPGIKQRKLIRLITFQSPVNYFYERGRLRGFEYDLVKKFAEEHGMRLDVVIAESQEKMLELLHEGKGDLVAASIPENRYSGNPQVKLSVPYNFVSPVIIGRDNEDLVDIRDLAGRTVHLPQESPYLPILQRIRRQGVDFTILKSEPGLNTESVLFRVAQGIYDLSLISSHEVKAELSRQLNLKAQFALGDPQPLVWLVRNSNTLLLSTLNDFIATEYRKGFYNVIYARYIDRPDMRITDSRLFAQVDQLSPYDELVHKYADHYGFDWRLIVAQMYQESRFNPLAKSKAGAEGLMQLMPGTADMIGIRDLNDPENSIRGGIGYMDYLRGQFENGLSVEERTWFTLASYNAGYNRVKAARALADAMDLDRNKWFNNVEIAMIKLATPYRKNGVAVRDCQCGQAAAYVREIRTLYNNYLRLTQTVRAASRIEPEADEI